MRTVNGKVTGQLPIESIYESLNHESYTYIYKYSLYIIINNMYNCTLYVVGECIECIELCVNN